MRFLTFLLMVLVGAGDDKPAAHWAFLRPKEPALPNVRMKEWPQGPIDRFILARLEEKGLKPAPAADKRTLLRRATYNLTGLPPTMEETEAYVSDPSPEAFAKVVDRLLASPRYGERWGRHWLDVARYADTKGYVFEEERRFPFSYTYRDWVIRALNEDLPYDQFLIQQIAADRLDLGGDKRPLAAMGFLTLGRRFLNNTHDIIDDRIDVVTRGTMGLSVQCARCHDHKYDPIPIEDYYSLYGVFAASTESREMPLLGVVETTPETEKYGIEVKKRQAEIDKFLESKRPMIAALRTPEKIAAYLLAVHGARGLQDDQVRPFVQTRELNAFALERWKAYLLDRAKGRDPIFAPWFALEAKKEFVADPKINPLVAKAFEGPPPATLEEAAQRYGKLIAQFDKPAPLSDPAQEALRLVLHAPDSPAQVPLAEVEKLLPRNERTALRDLRKKLDNLLATHAGAPPRAMTLEDVAAPRDARVLLRGSPNNPGNEVPRRFLSLLGGKPFTQGSGRLEFAQAIASRDNPLTARVMVNRVWMHHFGAGLVRTPSDFGTRTGPPSHPELLDWLAVNFMEHRPSTRLGASWSLKKLHREILLSATWRQSSDAGPEALRIDPENRLLGRMNRERLDFEAMRDSLLAASGRLDPAMGGRGVDLAASPFTRRRAVYGFIERQNLPAMFRTFDFASPDTHSPQRFSTTVPQQALFMMNNPFVIEQARGLATRAEGRVERMYEFALGRAPTKDEAARAMRFIQGEKDSPAEKFAQVLLLSNEFAFLD